MQWTELAFLHWPVAKESLQRLLPAGVEVETHSGDAWLGIVPFRMRRTRIRGLPPMPTGQVRRKVVAADADGARVP